MYLTFYGLCEPPFELTPNPRFLFVTPRHREALANLHYGLSSAKPITLLVGEAGSGKTTLLRAVLESQSCRSIRCVYLSNPVLTRAEFVHLLARQFGLSQRASESKSIFLGELEPALLDRRARGETTALVVDEAQSLPSEILEEIRLLANFETTRERLLPVVLAGQPELATRLNDPSLRQLKQRIALRCELVPFTVDETAAYIAARVRVAGGDAATLFTREAVRAVHDYSHGIPRTISVICDNALVGGFALSRRPVDRDIVLEVCGDFDLGPARRASEDSKPARPDPSLRSDIVRPEPASAVPFEPESKPVVVKPKRGGLTVLGLAR
jgi:general secretion pathway protein A